MERFVVTLVILFFTLNCKATAKDQSISLDTGTGTLEGTLLAPENSNITVLIIAGSGPTDRNGNGPAMINDSLKLLAEGLAERGISSLRYDKRGVGASKDAGLSEIELRFENYIEDAKHWVRYLHGHGKFEQIAVIGHSEGSLIGMVASQSEEVTKFVSIAGAGLPIDQVIREQLSAQPAFVLAQSTPILDKLMAGQTVENVPSYLLTLFRPSVQPYMISWFKYSPQVELAKLPQPILIVQGTTDIQVNVQQAKLLSDANPNAKRVIIEGMNHVLKKAPLDRMANIKTYSQPQLPVEVELIDAVAEFLRAN